MPDLINRSQIVFSSAFFTEFDRSAPLGRWWNESKMRESILFEGAEPDYIGSLDKKKLLLEMGQNICRQHQIQGQLYKNNPYQRLSEITDEDLLFNLYRKLVLLSIREEGLLRVLCS